MIPTFIDTYCYEEAKQPLNQNERQTHSSNEQSPSQSAFEAADDDEEEALEPVGKFNLGHLYDLGKFPSNNQFKCKRFLEETSKFEDATLILTAGAILLFNQVDVLQFWANLPSVNTLRRNKQNASLITLIFHGKEAFNLTLIIAQSEKLIQMLTERMKNLFGIS